MKRHKSLHLLSHDHHHGLLLAQLLKNKAPEYKNMPKDFESKTEYLIRFYESNLIGHFRQEEKILYPMVKGKDRMLDSLFEEIFSEHNRFHSLINEIKLKPDPDKLDLFGNLLELHIRKEERELFEMVQDVLDEDELNRLESALKNDKDIQ